MLSAETTRGLRGTTSSGLVSLDGRRRSDRHRRTSTPHLGGQRRVGMYRLAARDDPQSGVHDAPVHARALGRDHALRVAAGLHSGADRIYWFVPGDRRRFGVDEYRPSHVRRDSFRGPIGFLELRGRTVQLHDLLRRRTSRQHNEHECDDPRTNRQLDRAGSGAIQAVGHRLDGDGDPRGPGNAHDRHQRHAVDNAAEVLQRGSRPGAGALQR